MEVRELRRANAILKSASACLSWRSVSARPVDLPVHRDQEGGVWGLADLQGAHWRRSQDRPEHLTHARRSRPPSARSLRDEVLKTEIGRVHKNQLLGAGGPQDARDAGPTQDCRASRCRSRGPVHRPCGSWATWVCTVSDAKSPRTTRSAPREQCPADLVKRHFSAFRPNELWVADIPPQAGGTPSYVRTFSGWVYVAFVTDVYSRRIVGWQTTCRPVCTDLALDALKMAVWQRKRTGADLSGLVHHLRPWGAVQVYSLRAGSGRLRGNRLGGPQGDSFRLRSG